jgi:hypothetical protein
VRIQDGSQNIRLLQQRFLLEMVLEKDKSSLQKEEEPLLKLDSKKEESRIVTNGEKSESSNQKWKTRVSWIPVVESIVVQVVSTKNGKRHIEYPKWTTPPQSFESLVELVRTTALPTWTQVPYVMAFPEFTGYIWLHRHFLRLSDMAEGPYPPSWLQWDQELFRSIVFASIRSGRPPLCAPDFFYYNDHRKKSVREWLFTYRKYITKVKWDYSVKTKKCEEHPDWPRFQLYVREELPTGSWLFPPEKWNKYWLSRMVIEKNQLEVREEIVQLMEEEGCHVELPRRRKDRWSEQDCETIRAVASKYWLEWRANAENKLRNKLT